MDAVFGADRTFFLPKEMECWHQLDSAVGKNFHLRNIRDGATADTGTAFDESDVILIDDDENNVERALVWGYRAFHSPEGFHRQWLVATAPA
jgi:hypothetical protein